MNAPDVASLVTTLRRDGVAVLPGRHADIADVLAAEHVRLTASAHPGVSAGPVLDGEHILATQLAALHANGFEALAAVLGAAWFGAVAEGYFGTPVEDDARRLVSVAYDTEKADPTGPGNQHLHWDPTLSLRMMLYVSDVDRGNGALEAIPGTHLQNHATRLRYWRDALPYPEKPECAGEPAECRAIEAPAGSVLLFDVSVTHRRGLVGAGRDRRVAFAHLHSPLARLQLAGQGVPPDDLVTLWPQTGGKAP